MVMGGGGGGDEVCFDHAVGTLLQLKEGSLSLQYQINLVSFGLFLNVAMLI